jgi:hypothetical protein
LLLTQHVVPFYNRTTGDSVIPRRQPSMKEGEDR